MGLIILSGNGKGRQKDLMLLIRKAYDHHRKLKWEQDMHPKISECYLRLEKEQTSLEGEIQARLSAGERLKGFVWLEEHRGPISGRVLEYCFDHFCSKQGPEEIPTPSAFETLPYILDLLHVIEFTKGGVFMSKHNSSPFMLGENTGVWKAVSRQNKSKVDRALEILVRSFYVFNNQTGEWVRRGKEGGRSSQSYGLYVHHWIFDSMRRGVSGSKACQHGASQWIGYSGDPRIEEVNSLQRFMLFQFTNTPITEIVKNYQVVSSYLGHKSHLEEVD